MLGTKPSSQDLASLGLALPRKRTRLFSAVALFLLLLVALFFWSRGGGADGPRFRTEPVVRTTLAVTVTATGTLRGLDTVEVGAELSGRVAAVHVEPNDEVAKGAPLASLDVEQLEARTEEARAQVQAADAALLNAEASATEASLRAERARALADKGLLSRQDLEAAAATATRAEAQVKSAQAQRTVSHASLRAAQSALGKAEILAPIAGVVLSRQVEPGQTVIASLQAPILFVLAKDLTHMALHVQVDEADVGKVAPGQQATFTVDAHPGRTFDAKVTDVRLYPTPALAGSTVVTYEAILAVDNADLQLRPGMTATASIATARKENALLVPNAALRFTPPAAISPGRRGGWFTSSKRDPGPEALQKPPAHAVWILKDGAPVAIEVKPGATDGKRTEVEAALAEGTEVLVDLLPDPA